LSCVRFKAHDKHWAHGNPCLCRASNTTPTANLSFAVRHNRAARQRGLHVNGAQLDRRPTTAVRCAVRLHLAHGKGGPLCRAPQTPRTAKVPHVRDTCVPLTAVHPAVTAGAWGHSRGACLPCVCYWRMTNIYVCRASPAGSRQSYNFFYFYTSFYFSTTKTLLCTLYSNLIHFLICLLYLTFFII
jgi:hypothetical protein